METELEAGNRKLESVEVLEEKPGHSVFLSHSSQDAAVAQAVCAYLEREGIKCWLAPRKSGGRNSQCILSRCCRIEAQPPHSNSSSYNHPSSLYSRLYPADRHYSACDHNFVDAEPFAYSYHFTHVYSSPNCRPDDVP
jgi:hypothetical protein